MPDSPAAPANHAVFLSYAREDAEAARRIADALRSQGLEVWFDQNELRGGDAWDQKIRKQINDCTLFLPIISAHTQGRSKGYFRLEWKLAVEQTHLMAEGVPFLAPIVIDDTPEAGAVVPPEFMRVQWTRLPGALPTPQFVEQVKRLLAPASNVSTGGRNVEAGVQRSEDRGQKSDFRGKRTEVGGQRSAPPHGSAKKLIGVAAVFAVCIAAYYALRPATKEFVAAQPVSSSLPPPSFAAKPPMDLSPAGSAAGDKSIAVLPFANLSADKENEFFADGMHDELLTALAKIGALKVISRTSVLAYRDPQKRNLKQIAAELGVAHVLEGSVSRAGSRVRIIVQLIDAATDQHRWAETYSRDVSDVFQVQADISAQIAQALAATISPELKLALAHKLTINPAAYDPYLRARRWREISRRELTDKAKWEELLVSPLEQAVALDPKFAAAYAELRQVHSYLHCWAYFDPTPARLAKAKAAVDMALRLDPALPVAHLALGYYHYVDSLDYARATEEFAIALAAMPGDADVLLYLAATQRRQGRWAEATANAERACLINPRNPDIFETWVECLVAQRYYARAEQAADRALAIDPTNAGALRSKAQARFAREGDRVRQRSAVDAIPRAPNAEPPDPRFRQFGEAIEDGRFAEAVKIYEEASELFAPVGQSYDLNLRRYLFAATAVGEREKVRVRALAATARSRCSTRR